MKTIINFSQNREDIILYALLKPKGKGFYVDIGANHPYQDSVTKLFYDQGWNGINVEPIRKLYNLFEKERPRDTNLNIGISVDEGEIGFREYSDHGLSTSSVEVMKQRKKSNPKESYKDYSIKVKQLKTVLAEANVKEIDFLKVDVEGLEYEVLKSNDWTKFRPKVLCIEANHTDEAKDWKSILTNNTYTFVFFDGLNEYWVANEQKKIINSFDYAKDIIEEKLIIKDDLNKVIESLKLTVVNRDDAINHLQQAVAHMDQLQKEVDSMQKIKPVVRRLGKLMKNKITPRGKK